MSSNPFLNKSNNSGMQQPTPFQSNNFANQAGMGGVQSGGTSGFTLGNSRNQVSANKGTPSGEASLFAPIVKAKRRH